MASTTEGTPYVEASDLVSGWPAVSQSLAEEIDDRIGNPDTSAPSAPSTGQLWVDTTSTPILKVYTGSSFDPVVSTNSGMVLITTQSFTTASAVNVNNCFTSTYDSYRLVIDVSAASAASPLLARLRLSGTDSSTGYDGSVAVSATGSISLVGANNTSDGISQALQLGYSTIAAGAAVTCDMVAPALARRTVCYGFASNLGTNFQWRGSWHNVATAYDGFTLYPTSGTVTGSLSVYGYKK